MRFEHETLAQRVCFASGDAPATVRAEAERLGGTRVMVIAAATEADLAEKVTTDVPVVLRHDEVVMHVPLASAERARATAATHDVDLLVSADGAQRPA